MALKYTNCLSDLSNVFADYPLEIDELDQFYQETIEIRTGDAGLSPIEYLYAACTGNPRGRNAHLLMGHRGCGKSTELNRLAKRFKDAEFPVRTVYCDKELDRTDMAYTDILILMAEALISIANELGCSVSQRDLQTLLRFHQEIERVDVSVKDANLEIADGADVQSPTILSGLLRFFISLKASLKFNQETRVTIRETMKPRVSEWLAVMDRISELISEKNDHRQPILIFEDLDKGNSWDVFHLHGEQLTGVHFPIIYTFPIGLSFSTAFSEMDAFFDVRRLPMIMVRTVSGEVNPPGVAAIRRIVERRCNLQLFEEDVINYLIDMTGGSLRDLFYTIREASFISMLRRADAISMDVAKLALRELRNRLKIRVDASDFPFLRAIHENHRIYSDREKLLKMMEGDIVLEYNGENWYDLHPVIEEFLRDNGVFPQPQSGAST